MLKKSIVFALSMAVLLLIPANVEAYKHGYNRKTDEIYATARHEIPIYTDDVGSEVAYVTNQYAKICVIDRGEDYYQVEYESKKNGTQIGWVSKGDFYSDCLIYDGREKQAIADGDYEMSYGQTVLPSEIDQLQDQLISKKVTLPFHFTYVGDGHFIISHSDTGEYIQGDAEKKEKQHTFWGPKKTARPFTLERNGAYFSIQDSLSNRYLVMKNSGVIYYDEVCSSFWKLRRYEKAITDESLRVFVQYDPEWANHYYGPGKRNPEPYSNVFCTSACGIFSTVNAIYSLTGIYPNPYELANYAVKEEYRILDCGTDNRIFKAVANQFGWKYGFSYDGSSGDVETLIKKLNKGDVAIVHVPGHYVSIVSYNKKTKKFLLLDSHYLPKRGTNAYGDWVSKEVLNGEGQDGNLEAHEIFFYKMKRPVREEKTKE